MSTRREFLWNCAALTAAAALTPAPALAVPSRSGLREVGLDDLSAEAFAGQVNTRFVVRDSAGPTVSLLLATIEPAASGADIHSLAAAEPQEQFSLFFAGPVAQRLGQNTYAFEHASLGRFQMFIVPVGRPVSGCWIYEAVFDRPTPALHGRGRSLAQEHSR